MVETFVVESHSFKSWATHADLRSASAALPPGSYTTLRTYKGNCVLRLEQHTARLRESLRGATPLEPAEVVAAVARALERAGHAESRLRLTFAPPRLYVTVAPFAPLSAEHYRDGVRCLSVTDVRRESPRSKRTDFIATAAARHDALPAGIEEALMVAEDGSILEGLSSNFFAVRDGRLWTEDARALAGVTRSIVLELSASVLPSGGRAPRLDEAPGFAECFLTSVSREILPVVALDGRDVAGGRPGPKTRELMRRFALLVEREARPVSA